MIATNVLVSFAMGLLVATLGVHHASRLPSVTDGVVAIACLTSAGLLMALADRKVDVKGSHLARVRLPLVALLAGVVVGALRGLSLADAGIDHRLAATLEGVDLGVTGRVDGLAIARSNATRFDLILDEPLVPKTASNSTRGPRVVRLNWYRRGNSPVPAALAPGDRCRLVVRLKRVHSAMNPGGFDFEYWAFRQSLHAVGYVKGGDCRAVATVKLWAHPSTLIDRARRHVASRFEAARAGETTGLLLALSIGERAWVTKEQWRVLRRTGTSHLMAISGMHVGLAALWGGIVAGLFLRRRSASVHVVSPMQWQIIAGLIVAVAYACLAGLSIPTQRALIMLVCVTATRLLRRHQRADRGLAFAFIAVLVYDPFAVGDVGFWLSFAAVTVIGMAVNSNWTRAPRERDSGSPWSRLVQRLGLWVRIQWVLFVFLAPLLLIFFQQVSIVSVVANLVAVPFTSLVVVPLVLIAIAGIFVGAHAFAGAIVSLAGMATHGLWWPLEWLSSMSLAAWSRPQPTAFELGLVLVAIVALHLPIAGWGRRALLCASLPLVVGTGVDRSTDEIEVAVLDVGQGLAIVVRSQRRALIFDTGAAFASGATAAEGSIVPYLRRHGIRVVDTLIVSHSDNDHAGGLPTVLRDFPVKRLLVGPDVRVQDMQPDAQVCTRGQRWRWAATDFEILSPSPAATGLSDNDSSCVLRIQHQSQVVLIPGDIEANGERRLVASDRERLKADILVLAHHGSATSSTEDFLRAVQPQVAIASVGYRNPHGHPAKVVLERLLDQGVAVERTDVHGAILVRIGRRPAKITRYRQQFRRYWHHS